jgi:hypothetical protein
MLGGSQEYSTMKQSVVQGWMAWLVAVACGCALASGCEKISEKVAQKVTATAVERSIEKQTGAKVDLSSDGQGSISIRSDKGNLEINGGAGGKVPDNWPRDVPVYPGARVQMSMGNDEKQVLSLLTPDSPEKAAQFYKAKFASLKLEANIVNGEQTMISYRDPGGRQIQLSIGKEQSDTQITLIVNAPKKPSAN